MTRVEVRLSRQQFRKINGPGGLVEQATLRAAGRVRDRAKVELTAAGRVDTGQLRASIATSTVRASGGVVEVRVGTDVAHARHVHDGTGVYGPSGRPIVPRRAKVLRFRPRGSTAFVFARQVAGIRPVPYLTRALDRLGLSDFT